MSTEELKHPCFLTNFLLVDTPSRVQALYFSHRLLNSVRIRSLSPQDVWMYLQRSLPGRALCKASRTKRWGRILNTPTSLAWIRCWSLFTRLDQCKSTRVPHTQPLCDSFPGGLVCRADTCPDWQTGYHMTLHWQVQLGTVTQFQNLIPVIGATCSFGGIFEKSPSCYPQVVLSQPTAFLLFMPFFFTLKPISYFWASVAQIVNALCLNMLPFSLTFSAWLNIYLEGLQSTNGHNLKSYPLAYAYFMHLNGSTQMPRRKKAVMRRGCISCPSSGMDFHHVENLKLRETQFKGLVRGKRAMGSSGWLWELLPAPHSNTGQASPSLLS